MTDIEHEYKRCFICHFPTFSKPSLYLLPCCAECEASLGYKRLVLETSQKGSMLMANDEVYHCECEHSKHEIGLGYCPNPISNTVVTDYGRYELCIQCIRDRCMPVRRMSLTQASVSLKPACSVCKSQLTRYDLCDNEGSAYCSFCYDRTFIKPLLDERRALMVQLAENEKAVRIHSARIAHQPPDDMPGLRHECKCGSLFQTWVALAIHCDEHSHDASHGVAIKKASTSSTPKASSATPKRKLGFVINYTLPSSEE